MATTVGHCWHTLTCSDRGVVKYTRVYNKHQLIPPPPPPPSEPFQDNGWCEIRLRGNDKLLIGYMCSSPNSSCENNTRLAESIQAAIPRGHSHVIVMGDFNHHGLDWTTGLSLASTNHTASTFLESI